MNKEDLRAINEAYGSATTNRLMYIAVDNGEYEDDPALTLGVFDSLELAKKRIRDYANMWDISPDGSFDPWSRSNHLAVYEFITNKPMSNYYHHLRPVWSWGKE